MAQISTVLVPARVIQYNNTIMGWDGGDAVMGQLLNVPCRNDFIDDTANYWAVPIKDTGIFSGFSYVPKVGVYASVAPEADSLPVFRVRDKMSNSVWWIYGMWSDFINSCSTCCGSASIPMPLTLSSPIFRFQPCETICLRNADDDFYTVWGLPSLGAGQRYFPYGFYNNVMLPSGSATGYLTVAALLVFLNASWTPFVWTASADNLTLIATGGNEEDTLCVTIVALSPSS